MYFISSKISTLYANTYSVIYAKYEGKKQFIELS